MNALAEYLARRTEDVSAGFLGYLCALTEVAKGSPDIASTIVTELADQRSHLKLIASENYCSLATQLSMGNLLTDKYAEGYPFHRFYAGCDNIDQIEAAACEEAKKLFGSAHAYVQPHSGADANLIAFWAILHTRVGGKFLEKVGSKKLTDLSREDWGSFRRELSNQRLLALDYYSGGHLTHGYRFNVSAQMFDCYSYTVDKASHLLDYDEIARQTLEVKPLILLAGYSAYPRALNFKRLREIADSVGAVLMVDMAHFAGLVAGGVFQGEQNPIPYADVVTSTTHKTLRGPRGGIVLCTDEFAEQVDKGCPLVMGGPLPHVMAAKAVSFREANSSQFKDYSKQVAENAKALAAAFVDQGVEVLTGGTENHLIMLNVSNFGITGLQAEGAVRECGITLNRNSIPFDPNGAWFTSGLRLGTPALTTLGMGESEMREIAGLMKEILANTTPAEIKTGKNAGKPSRAKYELDAAVRSEAKGKVEALLARFPLYPEIDLPFLQKHFC